MYNTYNWNLDSFEIQLIQIQIGDFQICSKSNEVSKIA